MPTLPAIPSIPGGARWKAMVLLAHKLVSGASAEMQAYNDDPSVEWQESPRAMEMLEKLERLSEIADELQSLE